MIYQILDFLNQYYRVIMLVLFLIGVVILFFKKGHTKSDFMRVFELVNKAEELFPEPGSGAAKLAYVIGQLKDLDPYNVVKMVDEVLSSPEKK